MQNPFLRPVVTRYLKKFTTNSSGFTLIECLVALTIVGIMLAIGSSTMTQNLHESLEVSKRYEAVQAAQTVLDKLRFESVDTFTTSRSENVTIGSRIYTVATTFCELDDLCISSEIKHITIRVKYGAEKLYETDTVFSKL